jgi:hypothetical protein
VLLRSAAETEGAMSGEAIEAELARVSNQDRRELVMLWAADPQADLEQLRDRLLHKVGQKLSLQALRCELGRLGLVDVPDEECVSAMPARPAARKRTKPGAARKAS